MSAAVSAVDEAALWSEVESGAAGREAGGDTVRSYHAEDERARGSRIRFFFNRTES